MAKWLVTIEHMYSKAKRNMVITTLGELPTGEEIYKTLDRAKNEFYDANYVTAHVITFMQKLGEG